MFSGSGEGTGQVASGIGRSGGVARGGRSTRPYRRYRPLPALIVIGVLGVVAIIVWGNAIVTNEDVDEAVRCEPAASPPPGTVFTSLGHSGLDGTAPVPPSKVSLRVLNASGARNEATMTTLSLKKLGFTQAGEPGNDPAYEGREAKCHGQIRFGENGAGAARTLSLVDPCIELVRDNRKDASVDLVIGTMFRGIEARQEGLRILEQLATWQQEHGDSAGGGEQATGPKPPAISEERMTAARSGPC